jgi:hypothetical protein
VGFSEMANNLGKAGVSITLQIDKTSLAKLGANINKSAQLQTKEQEKSAKLAIAQRRITDREMSTNIRAQNLELKKQAQISKLERNKSNSYTKSIFGTLGKLLLVFYTVKNTMNAISDQQEQGREQYAKLTEFLSGQIDSYLIRQGKNNISDLNQRQKVELTRIVEASKAFYAKGLSTREISEGINQLQSRINERISNGKATPFEREIYEKQQNGASWDDLYYQVVAKYLSGDTQVAKYIASSPQLVGGEDAFKLIQRFPLGLRNLLTKNFLNIGENGKVDTEVLEKIEKYTNDTISQTLDDINQTLLEMKDPKNRVFEKQLYSDKLTIKLMKTQRRGYLSTDNLTDATKKATAAMIDLTVDGIKETKGAVEKWKEEKKKNKDLLKKRYENAENEPSNYGAAYKNKKVKGSK